MNYIKKPQSWKKLKNSKLVNKNFLTIQNWRKFFKNVLAQPGSGLVKKSRKETPTFKEN